MARFLDYGNKGELYLAPIDGGGAVRLASDLLDYRMYSMPVRPFAFAPPGKRLLYLSESLRQCAQIMAADDRLRLAELQGFVFEIQKYVHGLACWVWVPCDPLRR